MGFSILEMMLALTVASLLFFPLLDDYYARHQSKVLRDAIVDVLTFAEQKALSHQQTIGVCSSRDGVQCDKHSSDNLLIFFDKYRDGRILSQDQLVLQRRIKIRQSHVRWKFFPYYRSYLKIRPSVMNMTDNGSVWVRVGRYSWRILVNKTGNVHFVAS